MKIHNKMKLNNQKLIKYKINISNLNKVFRSKKLYWEVNQENNRWTKCNNHNKLKWKYSRRKRKRKNRQYRRKYKSTN